MKQFAAILILGLSLWSCRSEYSDINPAPAQVAWESENYTLSFRDSLELRVIFNKAWPSDEVAIPLNVQGSALEAGVGLMLSDSLRPLAGDTEVSLFLYLEEERPDWNGLEIEIEILGGEGYSVVGDRSTTHLIIGPGHDIDMDIWAPQEEFARLWGFDNDPNQETGPANGRHFAFVHPHPTRANIIGLYNNDTTRSTNIFNMHRIYADQDVQSASARLRMEQALEFIPASENNAREGTVKVIEQNIRVHRKSSTNLPPFFYIGIKGEGTYSEITETIELEVIFDESDIGGEDEVVYYFRLQPEDN